MNSGNNGWVEYQKLVLSELKRLNDWMQKLDDRQTAAEIKAAIMSTKQKASMAMYGAIGSAIPVAVGLGIWAIKSLA